MLWKLWTCPRRPDSHMTHRKTKMPWLGVLRLHDYPARAPLGKDMAPQMMPHPQRHLCCSVCFMCVCVFVCVVCLTSSTTTMRNQFTGGSPCSVRNNSHVSSALKNVRVHVHMYRICMYMFVQRTVHSHHRALGPVSFGQCTLFVSARQRRRRRRWTRIRMLGNKNERAYISHRYCC